MFAYRGNYSGAEAGQPGGRIPRSGCGKRRRAAAGPAAASIDAQGAAAAETRRAADLDHRSPHARPGHSDEGAPGGRWHVPA